MFLYKWSLISLSSLGLMLFISCGQNNKNDSAAQISNIENNISIQCDSNAIEDLIKKVALQKEKGQFLEALVLSKELVTISKLDGCPQERIKIIQLHIELLYNYGLERGITYEMDELLNEAILLLEQNRTLLPAAKEIFYWAGILTYGKRNYSQGVNYLQIALQLTKNQRPMIDTAFLVNCYSKIATLQKGAKEYQKANESFSQALELADYLPVSNPALQLLKEDLATYNIAKQDSVNTFLILDELMIVPKSKRIVSIERLKALWYFKTNQINDAINSFLKVEQLINDKQLINQRHIIYGECTWVLSRLYLKKRQHNFVQQYLIKYLAINEKYTEQKKLQDYVFLNDETYKGKNRDFLVYGLIAESLALEANEANNVKNRNNLLNKSLTTLQIVDTTLFSFSLMNDEETAANLIQEFVLEYYPKAIDISYQLYESTQEKKYFRLANLFLERFRSFSLVKNLKINLQTSKKNGLSAKLKKLEQKHNKLKTSLAQEDDYLKRIELIFVDQQRQRIMDSLEKVDKLFFEDVMQKKYDPQLAIDGYYKNNTRKTGAILQYFINKQSIYILYNDNTSNMFVRKTFDSDLLFNLQQIKKDISAFNLNYNEEIFKAKNRQIFELLIGEELHAKCLLNEKVLIIPDVKLNNFPFEILVRKDKFWVQYVNIQYAFSLQTFLNTEQKILPSNPKILAFSFSSINDHSSNFASDLLGTAKEVNQIKKLYPHPNNRYLFGTTCTKSRFIQLVKSESADIIHLATHGVSNQEDKYSNYLVFRNEKNSTKISKISEYEIEHLSVTAPLIVLSACSTHQGKLVDGEGLYSIARAFKKAGAHQVITTFWDVEDHFTSRLTQTFYQNLKITKSPSNALWIAKKSYLQQSDNLMRQPYFWAGIICLS